MTNCKNCGSATSEKFCPQCGQAAKLKRIDAHYVSHEIQHLLHLEKGFLYTAKELFLRPGQMIREYIGDNRSKHVKPIPYLIITSLLYTLVSHYFHIGDVAHAANSIFEKSSVFTLLKWVEDHYGYANILMCAFIALWLQLFFRKYRYNIFEIVILLCFVMGQGMLLLTLFSILAELSGIRMLYTLMVLVTAAYTITALGQFFDKKKAGSYIKGALSYLIGMVSFYLVLIIIGVLYDSFRH